MVTPCEKCGGQRVVHYGVHCMECEKPKPKEKIVHDMILCLEYVKYQERKRAFADANYFSPFDLNERHSVLGFLDYDEFHNDSYHNGLDALLSEGTEKYDRFLEYFPGTEEALFLISW